MAINVPDEGSKVVGHGTLISGGDPSARDHAAALQREVERLGLLELAPKDLERLDARTLLHKPTGELWTGADRWSIQNRDKSEVCLVVEGSPPSIRYLVRPEHGPRTLAEREARERRKQIAAERVAREQATELAMLRSAPPATTITLNHLLPQLGSMTLRGIVAALESSGLVVVAHDGGARVTVQGRASADRFPLAEAVYRAAAAGAFKGKKGVVTPEELPDRQLLPDGSLLPGKLIGRE
jgi:hypothetical protein